MKPMALNLSKMKKISQDGESSTFLHPSGHRMVIAHKGISALQRKQLEKMPIHNFDEGGDTTEIDTQNPSLAGADLAKPQNGSLPGLDQAEAEEAAQDRPYGAVIPPVQSDSIHTSSSAPIPSDGGPAPASVPTPGTSPVDIQGAYGQGQKAISENQAVESEKAKKGAAIENKAIIDKHALNEDFQTNLQAFNKHQQEFMKDIQDHPINVNHYIESMSIPKKIVTAIGLLLGGAATPLTGKNTGAEFLNQQIERDIQGQMARNDQKKTLLGANQAMFHDNVLATNQTRINLNDIYDHQIQQAALKLGTPQAKANADAAHSKFALENAALLQQNAMRSTVLNHLKSGGNGVNAIDLANAGVIPHPEAIKEQASIDAQKTAIQKTQELYDALNKEQSAGNLLNPQSYNRVKALNAELVNAVMNASASKRLTRESVEQEIAPLEIGTGNTEKTRGAKLQGLLNIVQRHADPTPYMSHFAPQSLPKYGEASAPQYKTVNGVRYKRGPNGEAVRVD